MPPFFVPLHTPMQRSWQYFAFRTPPGFVIRNFRSVADCGFPFISELGFRFAGFSGIFPLRQRVALCISLPNRHVFHTVTMILSVAFGVGLDDAAMTVVGDF